MIRLFAFLRGRRPGSFAARQSDERGGGAGRGDLPAAELRDREAKRYPVLYLLHGIADSYKVWTDIWKIPAMADEVMSAPGAREFLIVMPNGVTRFLGSYYSNSPVIGRWEDFIADDL